MRVIKVLERCRQIPSANLIDYSRSTLLGLSGTNGAGKSTHIQTMLPDPFEGIFSFDIDQTRVFLARDKGHRSSGNRNNTMCYSHNGGKAFFWK